ncbi:hypothetical protein BDV32DRAFT_67882 [Aspergillus pseudonomiae]|nr:hypothetical protein BDV32DRAFT_67882 [Aspergillus pseudonomiae]
MRTPFGAYPHQLIDICNDINWFRSRHGQVPVQCYSPDALAQMPTEDPSLFWFFDFNVVRFSVLVIVCGLEFCQFCLSSWLYLFIVSGYRQLGINIFPSFLLTPT